MRDALTFVVACTALEQIAEGRIRTLGGMKGLGVGTLHLDSTAKPKDSLTKQSYSVA